LSEAKLIKFDIELMKIDATKPILKKLNSWDKI